MPLGGRQRAQGVHAAVRPVRFQPYALFSFDRTACSLSPDCASRVALHLGRIHPKKGLAGLLRAMAILRAGGRLGAWHLAIAGWDQDGHEAELLGLAHRLGLADRVHAVGPQFGADREATFRAADLFVLPSHSEGLPMAVLEAWARGLPVAMTGHCNLPEGFRRGAAVRIDTEPERMAPQLEPVLALGRPALLGMGEAGRTLVAEAFSWEGRSAEMAAVYRWLVGRGTRPDCVEALRPVPA